VPNGLQEVEHATISSGKRRKKLAEVNKEDQQNGDPAQAFQFLDSPGGRGQLKRPAKPEYDVLDHMTFSIVMRSPPDSLLRNYITQLAQFAAGSLVHHISCNYAVSGRARPGRAAILDT